MCEGEEGCVHVCVCVWQPYFKDYCILHNNTMKPKEQQKPVTMNDIMWM